MIGSGHSMVDLEELGQFFNRLIEKMRSPITNKDLWATKARDDIFMKENGGLLGISRFNCFSFYPLGQILHHNDNVLVPLGRHRCNWPNIINAPFL